MSWLQSCCCVLLLLLPCVTCDRCEVLDTCVFTDGNEGASQHTHQKSVEENKDACGQKCCQNDLCTMAVFFRSTEPGSPNCRLHLCDPTSACHSIVSPDGDADLMCIERNAGRDKRDNDTQPTPQSTPQQTTPPHTTQVQQSTLIVPVEETQTTSGAKDNTSKTTSSPENIQQTVPPLDPTKAINETLQTATSPTMPTTGNIKSEENKNTGAQTTTLSKQDDITYIASQTLAGGIPSTTKASNIEVANTNRTTPLEQTSANPLPVQEDADVNSIASKIVDGPSTTPAQNNITNTTPTVGKNTTVHSTTAARAGTQSPNDTTPANGSVSNNVTTVTPPEQQLNSTTLKTTTLQALNSTVPPVTAAGNTTVSNTVMSSVTNSIINNTVTAAPSNTGPAETTSPPEISNSKAPTMNQTQPSPTQYANPPTNPTTPAPTTQTNSAVTQGQETAHSSISSTEKQGSTAPASTTLETLTQASNITATTTITTKSSTYSQAEEADAIEAAELLATLLLEDSEISQNMTRTNGSLSASGETVATLRSDSTMIVVLVSALSIGVTVFLVVVMLVGRRVLESWKRRHYSRIDYLVNGMYN